MLFATGARVKVARYNFASPLTRVVMFDQPRKSSDRRMLLDFNRGTNRLLSALAVILNAFHFVNFALPLAECPCSTSCASSNRRMLPNLNRGTDHLLSAFSVMLNASRFISLPRGA
jgi:hypothetical protein